MNTKSKTTYDELSLRRVDYTTWQPILRREWNQRKRLLLLLAGTLFAFGFLLPLWDTTATALIFSGVSAFVIALYLGSSDTGEGREAYAFTLPPRRADFFWSRFWFGFAWSLGLLVASLAIVYLDLSARFWGVFFESGLASPATVGGFDPPEGSRKFASFAITILAFPVVFSITSLAKSRAGGLPAALAAAALITVIPGLLSMVIGWKIGGGVNGVVPDRLFFSVFNLLAIGIGVLSVGAGFLFYIGKDAQPASDVRGRSAIIPVVLVGVLLLIILSWSSSRRGRENAAMEARRKADQVMAEEMQRDLEKESQAEDRNADTNK